MELDAKTMKKLSKNPTLMAQIANLKNTVVPLDENLSPAEKLRMRISNSNKTRSSKVSKEYTKEKRLKKEQEKLAKEQENAPKPEDTVKDVVIKTSAKKNKLKKLQAKYGKISEDTYKESMSALLKENINEEDRHHNNNIIQLYLKQNPVKSEAKKLVFSDSESDSENSSDNIVHDVKTQTQGIDNVYDSDDSDDSDDVQTGVVD